VRINKVLKSVLGLNREVVITGRELTGVDGGDGASRPKLEVRVRLRKRRRGPCGRCAVASSVRGSTKATAERVKWVLPVRSVGFRCWSRAC
jgi:hypothetical protein